MLSKFEHYRHYYCVSIAVLASKYNCCICCWCSCVSVSLSFEGSVSLSFEGSGFLWCRHCLGSLTTCFIWSQLLTFSFVFLYMRFHVLCTDRLLKQYMHFLRWGFFIRCPSTIIKSGMRRRFYFDDVTSQLREPMWIKYPVACTVDFSVDASYA